MVWLTSAPGRASAQPGTWAAREIAQPLGALLAKVPARTQIGLFVANAADGECWFAHQAQRPLKPASVLKLFVTAAALERFGPGFRYETRLYVQGEELWVLGAGDPSLGDERLARRDGRPLSFPFDEWAAALRARDVRTLERIVLDDSVFDQQWRHPDWPRDQATSWYQAPIGGLNFNDNCLDARVELHGTTVQLTLRPDLPPSFFENSLRVGKSHRPLVRRAEERDTFEFLGTVTRVTELGPIAAARPTVFFGYALRQALAARGITVHGEVVRRTIAPAACANAALVATHTTPLADVLWRCNTFSQNLFAECLLKSLAAYAPDGSRTGTEGSWERGLAQLRATLGDLGVDLSDAVLRDGSGLSHENRVNAEQIVQLLVRMYGHRHRAAFLDSLAVPGQEGSMRQRFADAGLAGRLRGKTGTLNGVRSLAGYVTRPDGVTLAFALLGNGECDAELPVRVARILAGLPAGP